MPHIKLLKNRPNKRMNESVLNGDAVILLPHLSNKGIRDRHMSSEIFKRLKIFTLDFEESSHNL